MKYSSYLYFLLLLIVFSCTRKPGNTEAQRLREENFRLKQENDSLKRAAPAPSVPRDTVALIDATRRSNPPENLTGIHAIALQWINRQYPGTATIAPDAEGWFTISGQQIDPNNAVNYLKINGRIRKITPRELLFEGTIETRSQKINAGKPCIRKGKNTFKATDTAPYWRMQDMINCEGGSATDYIDIYF